MFVLALSNQWDGIILEVFATKADLLKYLNENEWYLFDSVDWAHLEKYTGSEAEFIAQKPDFLNRITEAHLRVVLM